MLHKEGDEMGTGLLKTENKKQPETLGKSVMRVERSSSSIRNISY